MYSGRVMSLSVLYLGMSVRCRRLVWCVQRLVGLLNPGRCNRWVFVVSYFMAWLGLVYEMVRNWGRLKALGLMLELEYLAFFLGLGMVNAGNLYHGSISLYCLCKLFKEPDNLLTTCSHR